MRKLEESQSINRRQILQVGVGIAGFTIAPLLAACAAQPAPSSPAAQSAAPAPTKAAAPTTQVPAGTPPAKSGTTVVKMQDRGDDYIFKLMRSQFAEFQKEQPGIQVEFDDTTGNFFQKLQLQIASGTPPDVYFDSATDNGASYRLGIAEAVDDYLRSTSDFSEDKFDKNSWFALTYAGKRWGLPWDSGGCGIYFNIDLFNEAQVPLPDPTKPMSWDQLLTTAQKLTIDLNGKRADQGGFDPTRVKQFGFSGSGIETWGAMQFIFGNGGEPLVGSVGSPPTQHQVPFDDDAVVAGIQWLADLVHKYHVMPDPTFTQSTPITFANKTIAMNYDGVWALGRANQSGVHYGVFPFPTGKVPTSYGHYSPLAMVKSSKVKDATWTWMYWACLSEKGQSMLVDAGQMQPMRKSLFQRFLDGKGGPDKQYRQVFVDQLTSPNFRAVGDKVGSYYDSYALEWNQILTPIFDQVFHGTKAMKDVAKDTRQKLETLLHTGKVT
ncbi:MAG TPA: sugar ABC transporter substrate-binding protein [Chloroflexota bacterium]|nr:sugar ABC transporter substrate-binding protein [Chloroflexota bacterium]